MYDWALRDWRVCSPHRVTCQSSTTLNRRNAYVRVEVLWANW